VWTAQALVHYCFAVRIESFPMRWTHALPDHTGDQDAERTFNHRTLAGFFP
jgi:hypothetical protein